MSFGKFEGETVGRSLVRVNGTVVLDRIVKADETVLLLVEATVGSLQFRHKQGVLERVHVGKMARATESTPELADAVAAALAEAAGREEGKEPLPFDPEG